MEKEKLKVQVLDVTTKQVLFECPLEESERAYQHAAQMEELGLDIEVLSPTLTDSLSTSLGLGKEAQASYKKSLEEEMDSHEGSCCFDDSGKPVQ